jgi:hypothetical protein
MPTTYAIPDGRTVMAATTYTGTNSTQTISNAVNGVSFQPDFAWLKDRTASGNHQLFNSVVGAGTALASNLTSAEFGSGGLSAFNSNGFTGNIGSTDNYVSWQWKAGGTAVSNTSGSITSQVSANTTAGFSVVTYTSTTGTVGHGLGVAPSMIIMKGRNVTDQWTVGLSVLNGGSSPWNYGLPLNDTAATQTNSGFWNNTAPTSTVFSQGSWDSGYTKVAYCFAPVPGYSAFGSYTGNGSTDGTFVYTGFRPRFLLTRRTDSAAGWIILDSARSPNNVAQNILEAQSAGADSGSTYNVVDFLSNGFKFRITGDPNTSGASNIYMAFAETAFKYANAR